MNIRSKPVNENWYKNYPFKKKKRKWGRKTYKWENGKIVEVESKHKLVTRELI